MLANVSSTNGSAGTNPLRLSGLAWRFVPPSCTPVLPAPGAPVVQMAKHPGVAHRQIVEPRRIGHVDPGLVHRENRPASASYHPSPQTSRLGWRSWISSDQVAVALVDVVARVVEPAGAGIEEDPFNPVTLDHVVHLVDKVTLETRLSRVEEDLLILARPIVIPVRLVDERDIEVGGASERRFAPSPGSG